MRRLVTALVIVGAGLAGCGEKAAPATPADPPPATVTPSDVVIDQAAMKSITVETLAEARVPRTLTIPGKIQFDEDRLAHILAPLAGRVVNLRVKVGDAVQKGQSLFEINSREATAAIGEHSESHKDLDLAEKTAAMTEDLFNHQAASKIALQQAQSDLAKARSRVARNEQAMRLLGLQSDADLDRVDGRVPVVSPIRGSLIERHITEGEYVQSDSMSMMTVADLSAVWVIGEIFERDLHLVAVGDAASITTTAYPGEQFVGRVSYVSDVIDPASRTARIRVAVPNPGGRLKAEMFASIAVNLGDSKPILNVPPSAVFVEGGKSFVFVTTVLGHFVRRTVEMLHPGDRVVTDGSLLLREEEEKRTN